MAIFHAGGAAQLNPDVLREAERQLFGLGLPEHASTEAAASSSGDPPTLQHPEGFVAEDTFLSSLEGPDGTAVELPAECRTS